VLGLGLAAKSFAGKPFRRFGSQPAGLYRDLPFRRGKYSQAVPE